MILVEQVSVDMGKVTLTPQELPEELDETQTAEWRQKKKHIFILSESGKPVYSRWCTLV
jgi:hypothetical protein